MLILYDHGTPRGIAQFLEGHTVKEARAEGWDRLTNGELLSAAEQAGFGGIANDRPESSLPAESCGSKNSPFSCWEKARWRLIRACISNVVDAVNNAKPGTYLEIEIPDTKATRSRGNERPNA